MTSNRFSSNLLFNGFSTCDKQLQEARLSSKNEVNRVHEEEAEFSMEDECLGERRRSSITETFDSFRTSLRERGGSLFRNLSTKRGRNRLVQKNGLCNISLVNVPKQKQKYFSDIFTTVIDVKWRWCLLFFSLSFVASWTTFTLFYYLFILFHGDLGHVDDTRIPCVANVRSLLNVFLFAFTTQTTIGYGFRYPTDECPQLIVVMCFQFIVGVMIQTLMAGVIFAKLARPIKRAETIIFSKNAVISMRDGKLCLLFRVGDMRKSSLAEAHVRLQMIKNCITEEGELLPFHQFDMDVGYEGGLDRVFVIWPITICHEIDHRSPLYDVSKESLSTGRFEIIAILEGVVESTGSTTQATASYLPSEILWGKRFEKLVTYQRENGEYRIDFGKFHNTYEVDTPEYSMRKMNEMKEAGYDPINRYRAKCFAEIENEGRTPYATIHRQQEVGGRGNGIFSSNRPSILDRLKTNGGRQQKSQHSLLVNVAECQSPTDDKSSSSNNSNNNNNNNQRPSESMELHASSKDMVA